jgi:predicted metalloprotease with PDZ domain
MSQSPVLLGGAALQRCSGSSFSWRLSPQGEGHGHPSALLFTLLAALFTVSPATAQTHIPIRYTITLTSPTEHFLEIAIAIPPGPAQRELQLPVWNATYQIRDFAEYVLWIRARTPSGAPLPTRKLNKSRWLIEGLAQGGTVEYEVLADQPGPFGAQLNTEHAFFNFAEILMYPADARDSAMSVRFAAVPNGWRVASALQEDQNQLQAPNYDTLVDSPVELSKFQESTFTENGGHYRIVVHAAPDLCDLPRLTDTLRKIVHAETAWMQDRPFQNYLFLFHFPENRGDGGMEHAYSTAIELSGPSLQSDPGQLASMAAHEFFHLWNVKRIRPQTLAPPDYTKENYTRALWFSEGVTSTVEQYALLQSHLVDERSFLRNLSEEITTLQNRPAHLTQSAEESSLDTWLEKYPQYRQPGRSISYYNKGFLLGILLDLAMRQASNDEASLQELFQYLDQTYARKEKFFDDSEGVRKAAEVVSGSDLSSFFNKYVAGTDEIPYNEFFAWVGLHVVTHEKTISDPGFRAARNFDLAPVVVYVQPNSDAARAGLVPGDTLLTVDDAQVSRDFETRIAIRPVGEVLHVRVRAPNGSERDLMWKLSAGKTLEYEVDEAENPTLQQLLHRRNWLTAREAKVTHARAHGGAAVLARAPGSTARPKGPQPAHTESATERPAAKGSQP